MGKIDMLGKTFGYLTVIEETEKRTAGRSIIWKCRCKCGNECEVDGYSLRKGNTKSCGCLQKEKVSQMMKERYKKYREENIINQKFDMLTVIKDTGKRTSDGKAIYLCLCECGRYCERTGNYLIRKNYCTKSCGCLTSSGEAKIIQILNQNNILFETQKTFETCIFEKSHQYARFDFYIPEKNYIIEYDGIQHFKITGWNTEEKFQKVQEHDRIKNQYCFNHNMPIIRIPYTHLNKICLEDLLLDTSQYILKPENK